MFNTKGTIFKESLKNANNPKNPHLKTGPVEADIGHTLDRTVVQNIRY